MDLITSQKLVRDDQTHELSEMAMRVCSAKLCACTHGLEMFQLTGIQADAFPFLVQQVLLYAPRFMQLNSSIHAACTLSCVSSPCLHY
jgi:hypothetical protein